MNNFSSKLRAFARNTIRTTPTLIYSPIRKINITSKTNIANEVVICGRGSEHGQLGLGDTTIQYTPSANQFFNDKKIKAIVSGSNHTFCVSENDELFSFGFGVYGQLGHGDFKNAFIPKRIEDKQIKNKKIQHIACGGNHTIIAVESKTEGFQVYGCGRNRHGELWNSSNSEKSASFVEIFELRGKQVQSIACGEDFTIISSGNLKSANWKLGTCKIKELAAGWGHVIAATDEGVYSWGSNVHGQCGVGLKSTFEKPKKIKFNSKVDEIACGSTHSMILSEGKVFIFGSGADGKMASEISTDVLEPKLVHFTEKIKQIATGSDHLCVLTESGKLFGWGYGQHGCLGLGEHNLKTFYVPQLIAYHSNFFGISCSADTSAALV